MKKSDWDYNNLDPWEFACRCDKCPESSAYKMKKNFMAALEMARAYAGVSFIIERGYSCKEHNASIKGSSKTSEHVNGLGVDIRCHDTYTRFKIVYGLVLAGFKRIKHYKSHIHADMSKDKLKPEHWLEIQKTRW